MKDYCIALKPEDEAAVRSQSLAQCISERVDDERVKQCAKRASWLGNDETHYDRRWSSKDVEDLKALIRLTMNWVASSVLTIHYVGEMEDGQPE